MERNLSLPCAQIASAPASTRFDRNRPRPRLNRAPVGRDTQRSAPWHQIAWRHGLTRAGQDNPARHCGDRAGVTETTSGSAVSMRAW
jgi:hypothetical protein